LDVDLWSMVWVMGWVCFVEIVVYGCGGFYCFRVVRGGVEVFCGLGCLVNLGGFLCFLGRLFVFMLFVGSYIC